VALPSHMAVSLRLTGGVFDLNEAAPLAGGVASREFYWNQAGEPEAHRHACAVGASLSRLRLAPHLDSTYALLYKTVLGQFEVRQTEVCRTSALKLTHYSAKQSLAVARLA